MKRALVRALEIACRAMDEVLYRPAVVKAFAWVPRWWSCELAKLSITLDDRWGTSVWEGSIVPGAPCGACGRRASISVIGGWDEDLGPEPEEDFFLNDREIPLCGWCHVRGRTSNEEELQRALSAACRDSVSWRWRWRVRDAE